MLRSTCAHSEARTRSSRKQPQRADAAASAALNHFSEREGECRNASGEHDESECHDASRNQPDPSRSELPNQSEQPSLAELRANEPKRQDGERGPEPARRTELDEGPLVADTSLSTCVSGSDRSMLAIVGQHRGDAGICTTIASAVELRRNPLSRGSRRLPGLKPPRPATPMRHLPRAAMNAIRMNPGVRHQGLVASAPEARSPTVAGRS